MNNGHVLAAEAQRLWQQEGDQSKIPVWLDCDTGHDDAFAILVAALTPQLDLLGISTVYGNAPLSQTTSNTLSILKAIGRPSIPVHPGAAQPFCRQTCFAPDIHGSSGLDGTTILPAPTLSAHRENAITAAYEALISTPPQNAYVIATGLLTNIALLFSVHPDLAIHIKGLHIMGGAIGSAFTSAPMGTVQSTEPHDRNRTAEERFGNWTPFAEFNIYCDPEAAKMLFDHPVLQNKMFLAPLDLTHLFLATRDVQQVLLYGFNKDRGDGVVPVRKLFNEILTFFAQTYADVFGLIDGPPLHDVLPALAVFAPEIFEDEQRQRYRVQVVIDGEHGTEGVARTTSHVGQTVVQAMAPGEKGVRIPKGLNRDVAWHIIDLCLAEAEKCSPLRQQTSEKHVVLGKE